MLLATVLTGPAVVAAAAVEVLDAIFFGRNGVRMQNACNDLSLRVSFTVPSQPASVVTSLLDNTIYRKNGRRTDCVQQIWSKSARISVDSAQSCRFVL